MTTKPPLYLLAADGQPYSYPIPEGATLFRRVLLARRGHCYPFGAPDSGYEMDDALFAGIVASYDPQFFVAKAYIDHPGLSDGRPYCGPCEGLILALEYDAAAGELYGDVVALDWYFASLCANGQLPDRSIEWRDARLSGAKFYDKYDFYLTGCAFMGTQDPAVAGLGPLPRPEVYAPADSRPIPYVLPYAAQEHRLAARSILNPTPEVAPVDTAGAANPNPAGGPPIAAAAPSPADFAALQATVGQVQAALAAAQAENAQLRQQFQTSEHARAAESAGLRLNNLVLAGKVTQAELPALQEQLHDALCREPLEILAADGSRSVGKPPVELFFAPLEARAPAVQFGVHPGIAAGSRETVSAAQHGAVSQVLLASPLGLTQEDLDRVAKGQGGTK